MVILWQIFLGPILIIAGIFGGRYYTGVAYILIILWSISQTSGELTILQIFVQGIITGLLFLLPDKSIEKLISKSDKENEKSSIVMGFLIIFAFVIIFIGVLLVIIKLSR